MCINTASVRMTVIPCLVFAGLLSLSHMSNSQETSVDQESKKSSSQSVQHEAAVGKLFKYFLPKEFFKDGNTQLKVVEVGTNSLPEWLNLDDKVGALVGVPAGAHRDRHYELEVVSESGASVGGQLSLHVAEDKVHTRDQLLLNTKELGDAFQAVKCPPGASITRAAVIIDANADHMDPLAKARVVEALSSRLGLPSDLLKLLPAEEGKPLVDTTSALVSGLGDLGGATPQHPGVILQWEVGCGNVRAGHMPVLQLLESSAARKGSEAIGTALGHQVVGWHVTNERPQRIRRRVRHRKTRQKSSEESSGFYVTGTDIHRTDVPLGWEEEEGEGSGFYSKSSSVIMVTDTQTTEASTKKTSPWKVWTPSSPDVVSSSSSSTSTTIPARSTAASTETSTTVSPSTSTTASASTSTTSTDSSADSSTMRPNLPPVKQSFALPVRIKTQAGQYFEQKVPKDLFIDPEDGDLRNLNVRLSLSDDGYLPPNFWLQLDTDRLLMYGFPTQRDVKIYPLELIATDSKGASDKYMFEIRVARQKPIADMTHEISAKFDMNYEVFMADLSQRLELTTKLASAFGDSDPSKLTVTRLEPGSVVYAWTNNSMPTEPCPAKELKANLQKMVDPETQEIQPQFREALEPYELLDLQYKLMGSCEGVLHTPLPPELSSTTPPDAATKPGGPVVSKPSESSDNSMFVATVVPAVIIALLLVIAGIVACYLYRRKRKSSHDMDPAAHVRKGAPVIFADELDEPQDNSRTPLMLQEEKPPQPPPGYPRSNSGSLAATGSPPMSHRDLDHSSDDVYKRPLPFYSDSYAAGPSGAGPPPPPPYAQIPP